MAVDEDPAACGADIASDTGLTVTTTLRGSAVIVAVAGEVDLVSAPALARSLFEVLSGEPRRVVVDLSNVVFLASAGLQELVVARQQAAEAGVMFSVVAADHAVRRAIEVTGLDETLCLCGSVEEALAGPRPADSTN